MTPFERIAAWLTEFSAADLDETVADGGICAGQVWQQEARTVRAPQILALGLAVEQFAQALEHEDFSNVAAALGARMCCNGHMCGCRGSTVGEYLAWELRECAGLPQPS